METTLVVLPKEVQEIANLVSNEKRDEVNLTLQNIFAGTSDWKAQVDAIEVKGIDDIMSIKMADAARLNAKNARLSAEKTFDAKREEVQQQMQSYQLEDKLWLKAKQTMQLLFKDIEETAKYKSEFAKRYEAEQKELKVLQRINLIQPLAPEMHRSEFENMSDESFETFVSGLKKSIEDKKEAERLAEEARLEALRIEAERIEAQRLENEKLKEEARLRDIASEKERKANEEKIRLANIESKKAIAEANRLAKIELYKQAAILAKEQAEKAKIEAELKAKKEAEIKSENERKEKELKDKIAAEKMAKAPIKKQLLTWVNDFAISNPIQSNEKSDLIIEKFIAFKKWAIKEIESL